jgi:hypothetical protein
MYNYRKEVSILRQSDLYTRTEETFVMDCFNPGSSEASYEAVTHSERRKERKNLQQ